MDLRHRRPMQDAGFTLVELLVTLTILAVVVGLLTVIMLTSDRTHRRTLSRAEVQAAGRHTLSLMTTELRQAGADPRIPPVGVTGVVSADSVTVRVRADLNANGTFQTTEPSEDVTYRYDADDGVLYRNPGAGEEEILAGITDMRFTYFDTADQPLTAMPLSAGDRALVHTIGVSMTCAANNSQPLTLTTRITLRNQ